MVALSRRMCQGTIINETNLSLKTPKNVYIFKGVPVFLEEGDYSEIETFNILEYPKSIKVVKEDMGTPELFLASSTNYEG